MLEYIVIAYGYPALFAGSLLEGESVLIIAGFLAHLGFLNLPWVIAVALIGTLIGDNFYFFMGRRHGTKFLAKRPKWQARLGRIQVLMEKHQNWLLFGFRFLYQLRSMIPFLLGTTKVSTEKFVAWNAFGAVIWSFSFGLFGYYFGAAFETWIADIKHHETGLILISLAVIAAIWAFSRLLKKIFAI